MKIVYNKDVMKYYSKDGYIDFNKLLKEDHNDFIFMVGARGIGKTFGILKWLVDNEKKFIYMRRTQTQVDMIRSDELNPFNALTTVLGPEYTFITRTVNKNITAVYRSIYDEEKKIFVPIGPIMAYILALSTVANIRGFDASDVDFLVYDEFIGEKHEKPIRSEGTAFLNAVETIARNRQLQGREALRVLCLSNSTNLANPIFVELKLITPLEKMLKGTNDLLNIPDRDLSVYVLKKSPISEQKSRTALYRLAGTESDFAKMSLSNQFNKEYFGQVKSKNLKEYKPLVQVGEIVIYKHKAKHEWYCTEHRSGSPEVYDSSEIELKRFANDYYYLKIAYLNRHMFFESYIQQILFEKYMGM